MKASKVGLNIGAGTGESNDLFSGFDIVYCFEPNNFSFNKLKESNHDNLILYNYGISDIDGHKTFNNHSHMGYSSFLDLDESGEFYKLLSQVDAGFDIIESRTTVEVKRLDTFITEKNLTNINLIKVDAQGDDLNIVKSLGNYTNAVDNIIIECHRKNLYKNSSTKEDIISHMYDNHFILTHTDQKYYLNGENKGKVLEEDLTFKNKKNK